MGRPREGGREEDRHQRHQPEGTRSVLQSRQATRAGPGRHVQCLRVGQLLPRPGYQDRQPPGRPARHRHLCRARGAAGFTGLHRAAARRPHGRGAVLFRHPLSRAAPARGLLAARGHQAVSGAQRLALPVRRHDARRHRGHDADRALCDAGGKEGLPARMRGLLPRHRGGLRPRRCRDLRRLQPRGARSGAPDQRRQGRLPALFHRLPQREGPRDRDAATAGHSREPRRGLRSGADPVRRDAADLRLAQELGHAGGDGLPARAGEHGRAAARPCRGGVTRRRLPAPEPAGGTRHEWSSVQVVPRRSVLILLAAWLAACLAPAAAAEADFYAGKSIALLVGFSAGGGYDVYARTLARHMGRHIPGNPKLIPQNMPGAGSLKAVNYLYNVAPKDGTTIAAFAPGVVFEPLLGRSEGTQFAAPRFTWLGSISQEVSVCAFIKAAAIRTWRDMQTKSYVIGASGGGAESDVFPNVLRKLFNLPLKIVTGYPGGTEIILAMERREVDGRCGWSWTSLLSRSKALLDGNQIDITLQIGLQKDKALPSVPLIMDLTDDPRKRAALKLIVSRQSIARPFAAPPGVPADRAGLLRAAFDATMNDPEFRAEARDLNLDVEPVSGAEVKALLSETHASPPEVVRLATELVRDAQ